MTDAPDLSPWDAQPRYVQRWKDARNGKERIYFRKNGRRTELKQPWGTKAIAAEAAALLKAAPERLKPIDGTLVGAVRAYRGDPKHSIKASANFLTLAPSTQKEYDRWCDHFDIAFEGMLLEDIDAGFILSLRDKWAARGYRAANLGLQVLKNICKAPMIRGDIAGDPFAKIEKVARPHELGETNPRWLDEEVAIFVEDAIVRKRPGLARAIALGRWGGFRKQTICSCPRAARIVRPVEDGQERRLYWVTEKKLVRCDRREDPRLTALLARTEGKVGKVEPWTIAFNSRGEPWRPRALSHAIDREIERLAKQGKIRPTLTPHGLRHARGIELAYAGASDAEIMAQLDHATPRAAAIYRRQADRLRLADAAQDRVDAEIVRIGQKAEKRSQSGEA